MKYLLIVLISLFLVSCASKIESGFYTKNDSLIFKCEDIISINPFQNKKGTIFVDVQFTKQGLEKLCSFEKKHLGEKFSFKVNDNYISSNIEIRETISCNDNGVKAAPMIFNTEENVYLFIDSVKDCKKTNK